MAYTPPAGNAVNFGFSGSAYTPPAGDAINFLFTEEEVALLVAYFALLICYP
jgi:hypothetical protein